MPGLRVRVGLTAQATGWWTWRGLEVGGSALVSWEATSVRQPPTASFSAARPPPSQPLTSPHLCPDAHSRSRRTPHSDQSLCCPPALGTRAL